MSITIKLEDPSDENKLKGGENSHLKAHLLQGFHEDGTPLSEKDVYDPQMDLGSQAKRGWTNIGDISAALRTIVGLGEVYKDSEEPHIAVSSKHTHPVAVAKGKTQLEATIKAIAGDLNSPFGGVWCYNTPMTKETAEFLSRMNFVGAVAPEYEEGSTELLKKRILIPTGHLSSSDIDPLQHSIQSVVLGRFLYQEREPQFNVREEAVVVTGNNGNTDINSLDDDLLNDIQFAGNAAIYLASNLLFYVHDGAIAGLGDGCGARTVAARKARNMLEDSAYAALSSGNILEWARVCYGTPFSKADFSCIKTPIRIKALSDAFFPFLDGFVETTGIDRIMPAIGQREYVPAGETEPFIPKRDNFDKDYDRGLIPVVVVQPGGSLGDRVTVPMAEQYDIKMVFTMTPDTFKQYLEKGPGKGVTGRRSFGHIIMS